MAEVGEYALTLHLEPRAIIRIAVPGIVPVHVRLPVVAIPIRVRHVAGGLLPTSPSQERKRPRPHASAWVCFFIPLCARDARGWATLSREGSEKTKRVNPVHRKKLHGSTHCTGVVSDASCGSPALRRIQGDYSPRKKKKSEKEERPKINIPSPRTARQHPHRGTRDRTRPRAPAGSRETKTRAPRSRRT